jgi:hypothetical protein
MRIHAHNNDEFQLCALHVSFFIGTSTLPYVVKAYYKTRAAVSVNEEVKDLLLSFAKNLTEILSKREDDLVTPMARAATHVKPQVYM